MANKNRGEVSLKVGTNTYTLRYSTNALCKLEDGFDKTVQEIAKLLEDSDNVRQSHVRLFFHAAFADNHPELTVEDAGLIMSDAGMEAAMGAASEAFRLAFAPAEKGAGGPAAGKRKAA